MNVTCPFCKFEAKFVGKFTAHYALREHVQNAHPDLYKDMVQKEASIRAEHQKLVKTFGLAVRPLSMNL
jgi:hypothetical protein